MVTETTVIEWYPEHVARDRSTTMDVVFIHGLMGHPRTTWQRDETHAWPQWVADESPHVRVWSAQYPARPAAVFGSTADAQPSIAGVAALLANTFNAHGIGRRPCVWVCHSLGGLVAKRLLIQAERGSYPFGHLQVRGLLFLGTPHRGADLVDWSQRLANIKDLVVKGGLAAARRCIDAFGFSEWMPLDGAAVTGQLTALLKELKEHDRGLLDLNAEFLSYYQSRQRLPDTTMEVRVLVETMAELGIKKVVTADSADPYLFKDVRNAPIAPLEVPDTHSGMCKPAAASGTSWDALKDVLHVVRQDQDPMMHLYGGALADTTVALIARMYCRLRHCADLLPIWRLRFIDLPTDENQAIVMLAQKWCGDGSFGDLVGGIDRVGHMLRDHHAHRLLTSAEGHLYSTMVGYLAAAARLARYNSRSAVAELQVPPLASIRNEDDEKDHPFSAGMLELSHAAWRGVPARLRPVGDGLDSDSVVIPGEMLNLNLNVDEVGNKLLQTIAADLDRFKQPESGGGRRSRRERRPFRPEETPIEAKRQVNKLLDNERGVIVDARNLDRDHLLHGETFRQFLERSGVSRGVGVAQTLPDADPADPQWRSLEEALLDYFDLIDELVPTVNKSNP